MRADAGLASADEHGVDRGEVCNEIDETFIEVLRAFRRSGGLARDSDAFLLDRMRDPPSRFGGRWQRPICFEWGGSLWMPRFQFDLADMSMRPGPEKVIAELDAVFDGWEMAVWFARPNLWIGNRKPIDVIDRCLACVAGAARADRYIAAG